MLALLLGWAVGATLGHVGKLLSLAAWTWWPPGPRLKQAVLYPHRLWLAEAAALPVGVEVALDGALAGSSAMVAAGRGENSRPPGGRAVRGRRCRRACAAVPTVVSRKSVIAVAFSITPQRAVSKLPARSPPMRSASPTCRSARWT